MGAGADAEEVAEAPVVQVVPGAQAVAGVGGGLVLAVAVLVEQGLAGFLDVPEDVVLGQLRRLAPEHRVRLHGQLVPGEVRGGQGEGLAQVGQGVVEALPGQAVHQVEVEVVEAGLARHVGGAHCLGAVVDAPQGLQLVGLEALHADGQAIDAEAPVVGELDLFEGAGIGFRVISMPSAKPTLRSTPSSSRPRALAENRLGVPPPKKIEPRRRPWTWRRSCSRSASRAST